MKTLAGSFALALILAFSAGARSSEDTKSLRGSLFLHNPAADVAIPLPAYQVFLYSKSGVDQITPSPSITDGFGRYAFSGIQKKEYLLRIYLAGPQWRQLVWQQNVAPASTVLGPIVLRSVLLISPQVKFFKDEQKRDTFSLWIEVPEDHKKEISKVTYYFDHPTFKQKEYVGTNSSRGFDMSYLGWGCLTHVGIEVYLQSERKIPIDFDMCQALRESTRK